MRPADRIEHTTVTLISGLVLLLISIVFVLTLLTQSGFASGDRASVDRLDSKDFEPKPRLPGARSKEAPVQPKPPSKTGPLRVDKSIDKNSHAGKIWYEPVTGMELVWVPGGCFRMGCASVGAECEVDEKPVHEVCVDGFWIGKFEVTQRQWRRIMGSNPSYQFNVGEMNPVDKLSWEDAQEFIRRLKMENEENGREYSLRLPTEAEWEFACRGGGGGKEEAYSGGDDVDAVAWYSPFGRESHLNYPTHPVGQKLKNVLGLHDMSGNVHEWVEDVYDDQAYGTHKRRNPVFSGAGLLRVIRGGSIHSGTNQVRCSNRDRAGAGGRRHDVGFRLVREQ